jgi:hypothetical protein
VNALANEQVGAYLNRHFVSSFVKVGTFALVNGQKQGGNVASYFCLPDGSILHAIAGPVDANTLLHEARWVVDVHNLAWLEGRSDPAKYREVFRKAHGERLNRDFGIRRSALAEFHDAARLADPNGGEGNFRDAKHPVSAAKRGILERQRNLDNRARIHLLVALFPLVKVEDVYRYVFEDILKEKISALPVDEK